MTKKYTGQCACGAVTFAFDKDPEFIANCHCLDCKKASGGEMATFFAVPQDDFTLISGSPKKFHYTAASGNGLRMITTGGPAVTVTSTESEPVLPCVSVAVHTT